MNRAVVVISWYGGREAFENLAKSLAGCRYPVHVVISGSDRCDPDWITSLKRRYKKRLHLMPEDRYELGAFQVILDRTRIDEFLFLQDTFEVKDISFIDDIFREKGSVALGPAFFHYAGKWKRSVLEEMDIPIVRTKAESVHWEHTFSRLYWQREKVVVYDEHFHDGEHHGFVEAYGRLNMVLENQWYRKLKGDWGQRPL